MTDAQDVNRRAQQLESAKDALIATCGADAAGNIARFVDAKIKFDKAWDAAVKEERARSRTNDS